MNDESSVPEFLRRVAGDVEKAGGSTAAMVIIGTPVEGDRVAYEIHGWGGSRQNAPEVLVMLAAKMTSPANEPTLQ